MGPYLEVLRQSHKERIKSQRPGGSGIFPGRANSITLLIPRGLLQLLSHKGNVKISEILTFTARKQLD